MTLIELMRADPDEARAVILANKWDLRLWLPWVIAFFCFTSFTYREPEPEIIVKTETVYVEVEPEKPAEEIDTEALAVAKVLGGYTFCDREAQRGIVWLICNRAENPVYPDSITDVCEQPGQWQGDGTVIEAMYELAHTELEAYRNGGARPLPEGMLWMALNGDGSITFYDKFTSRGVGGHAWRLPEVTK